MMNIELQLASLLEAKSTEELFARFQQQLQLWGYDRVLLALFTDHPQLQLPAAHGIVKNYPDDWVAYYLQQNYQYIDPVCMLAKLQHRPFHWQTLCDQLPLNERQRLMFAEATEAKLCDGLGIPLRGLGGTKAGFGLARTQPGEPLDADSLLQIQALAMQFYACYCRLNQAPQPETAFAAPLSIRELDILQWLALGATKVEISDKLHISHHTVDYHVRQILKKLEVRNITAAVYFALSRGLLEPG